MRVDKQTSSWNEAAAEAAELIYNRIIDVSSPSLEDIRKIYDFFIKSDFGGTEHSYLASLHWTVIGAMAAKWGETSGYPVEQDDLVSTLIRKQRDYGSENISRFGRMGLQVRTHDKIARLENLMTSGKTPNNESIQDTVLDILGYSAIGIMWETDKFLLKLLPE